MGIQLPGKAMQAKAKSVVKWYVLRDLKRPNAKVRGYQLLSDKGFDVFTPLKMVSVTMGDKKKMVEQPVLPDLLFVHSSENALKPYINTSNLLQYRYIRGGIERKMIVKDSEMEHFMRAASSASSIDYYKPEEYNPNRIGKKITIKGGAFDGEEGVLVRVDGVNKKRLVVRLANLFVAVIELKESENTEAQ